MIKCPECGHQIEDSSYINKPEMKRDGEGHLTTVIYHYKCPDCECEFMQTMKIQRNVTVIEHGKSKMNYYLAVFDEKNGETTTTLFKIIKASNTDKAEKMARQDALENSIWDVGFESIRKLKYIQQIESLDDIPSPFMLKEE